MDVGNRNDWRAELVVPSKELLALIGARWPLEPLGAQLSRRGRASAIASPTARGEVGFISSVTQPFCGDCSRARLSSDGVLYTCLFATHGTSLRDALRGGASDAQLLERIRAVWLGRAGPLQRAARAPARDRRRAAPRSRCITSAAELAGKLYASRHAAAAAHGRCRRARRDPPRRDRRGAHAPAARRALALRKDRPPHQERAGI